MTESRINDLLSRMTLKEKIGHINQYFSRGNFAPKIVRQEKAGSVINTAGALTGASDDLPSPSPAPMA